MQVGFHARNRSSGPNKAYHFKNIVAVGLPSDLLLVMNTEDNEKIDYLQINPCYRDRVSKIAPAHSSAMNRQGTNEPLEIDTRVHDRFDFQWFD